MQRAGGDRASGFFFCPTTAVTSEPEPGRPHSVLSHCSEADTMCVGILMMRRFATIFLVLALLLGGGVGSCLAAIANAHALECCSKDCPRPPAHNQNECCAVGTSTQDGEVAPAMQLTSPDLSSMGIAVVPVSAIFAPSSPFYLAIQLADWSAPRLTRSALCSLQI